jgi:rhodanese-related sulfurtransferase
MSITDFFKPVSSMTAEEVRRFLHDHDPEDYNLIDVRQPKEYERSHIPGATLIPLGNLQERIQDLDRTKPTVVY